MTVSAKAPRRRRYDRLLEGSSISREELAVDYAIAPFDRRAKEADKTWGTDRLPGLVSTDTAAKYGRTLASLNAAIDAVDADKAADRAAACIRGMDAMDREARAAGHTPPKANLVMCDISGWEFGVLLDPDLWRIAEAEHPGLRIYTIRELGVLARAAEQRHPILDAVKDAFPGAQVSDVRKSRSLDDPIPF